MPSWIQPDVSLSLKPVLEPVHLAQAHTHTRIDDAWPAWQGMTVFRMWRDEAYLRAMLGYVSIFYTSFVLAQKPPPGNIFLELPQYQQFLQHTLALAHGAEVVMHIPPEQMPPGTGDPRTFLNCAGPAPGARAGC